MFIFNNKMKNKPINISTRLIFQESNFNIDENLLDNLLDNKEYLESLPYYTPLEMVSYILYCTCASVDFNSSNTMPIFII
jgi:hypothetical protein